ncbi:class II aldolase/adducin family protein [Truepera radiovictrix]|uniref:Class II aldolase/adducin family protein n=1 Tax=Truepera radiovictrix (strain DSM 17093 / CIP 108686 / LMG 22925 / RQ-24) TaxID=649638 RepID=D7CQ46_TRURR|nr:class II aldolase/adducin family protein [Truepera radiovictrix]ADI14830.1 class II aldolase/adducin family protein [Truepera radiovictrix DSM 17093]WMT56619.1 class II aldolase/adducin family protein [Truepera radiovictrix]
MSGAPPKRTAPTPTEEGQGALVAGLLELAHALGDPARDLAILGEGNVSAACGDGTFWVKASGSSLRTLRPPELSRVRLEAVLNLLARAPLSEEAVAAGLFEALTDPTHAKPSVETFLHALCLGAGAAWVGHTHPVAANALLCSRLGAEPFFGHVFPDAVVVCGPEPAALPYIDPGLELAIALREELTRYRARHETLPKLLLLENHGIVALGASAKEVLNITLMADKWARVLLGTYALGGPRFLPPEEVRRIDRRLDEHYRRNRLAREGEQG